MPFWSDCERAECQPELNNWLYNLVPEGLTNSCPTISRSDSLSEESWGVSLSVWAGVGLGGCYSGEHERRVGQPSSVLIIGKSTLSGRSHLRQSSRRWLVATRHSC